MLEHGLNRILSIGYTSKERIDHHASHARNDRTHSIHSILSKEYARYDSNAIKHSIASSQSMRLLARFFYVYIMRVIPSR